MATPNRHEVPGGMFGSGPTLNRQTWYSPTTNLGEWGSRKYDLSGITQAADMMKNQAPLSIPKYNPYQFSTPSYQDIGEYGLTSDEDYNNMFRSGLQAAGGALRKQGSEIMRGFGQGFGGGRLTGGAAKELLMKNLMGQGSGLQDIASGLSRDIMGSKIGERQTARASEWQQKADIARQLFSAEQQRQLNQSSADYNAAGFNADQARYMSTDQMDRARNLMSYGFQLPQLQQALNINALSPFTSLMGNMYSGSQSARTNPNA